MSFVYTLVNLETIVEDKLKPHNTIAHTHAKILVGKLERQVSCGDTNDEIVDP
jgi:hypothetical protein